MSGPRADFVCLSKKCQQDGASTVYELPVAAAVCPVCGSKRIQRLYNRVNVSTGLAKVHEVDRITEGAYNAAKAPEDAARDALRRRTIAPALAVPINKVNEVLASYLVSPIPLGPVQRAEVTSQPATPILGSIRGQSPRPDPNTTLRDKEYGIKVHKDRSGRFVNAEPVKA